MKSGWKKQNKKTQPELFDGLERKNTTILLRDLSPARNPPSTKKHINNIDALVILSVFELMEILTSLVFQVK